MSYSAEVISRARQRLAQAKADRELEIRRHLEQAYSQVPRLREIDLELRRTMAQAAQAAFVRGEDGTAAMRAVRDRNLELQRERAELAARHFEPDFLSEEPICPACGGSGYIGSTMCTCLRELCRQEQMQELSGLSAGASFSRFRLDYYSGSVDPKYGASPRTIMERNLQSCRRYAEGFSGSAGNLLFVGGTGLGKTFLAGCIAEAVAAGGYSVAYEGAGRLFSKLEKDRFSPSEESRRAVERLTASDLLILDDLGTEMPSQFVTAALYSLVNDRLLEQKPMVITTNLNVEEIARRYTPQIASRLYGCFTRLSFVGADIRFRRKD